MTADLVRPAERGWGADTFFSAAAQADNLGDAVIRRIALGWIPSDGRTVHLYVGDLPEPYVEVVADGRGDLRVYRSSRDFCVAWASSAARRRAGVVFAPGPRSAGRSVSETLTAFRALGMSGVTRLAGGPVVTVGGALVGRTSPALTAHRLSARMSHHHSLRDPSSRLLLGVGSLVPDVAFAGADPTSSPSGPPLLVISLREDRGVDGANLAAMVARAREQGVEPVLVTQVRRDESFHEDLATRLSLRHVGWGGRTHREQLHRLDTVYRDAAVVFSNRLHVCIFAARHGAVVVNAETRSGKVAATLGGVYGAAAVAPSGDGMPGVGSLARWEELRPGRAEATRRAALDVMRERVGVGVVLRRDEGR